MLTVGVLPHPTLQVAQGLQGLLHKLECAGITGNLNNAMVFQLLGKRPTPVRIVVKCE